MALSKSIAVVRYLLLFICLVTLGFQFYFVYVYIHNNQVFFTWKFYASTGIMGALFLVVLLTEIVYRISHVRRRKQQQRFQQDFEHHAPYLLPPNTTATQREPATAALAGDEPSQPPPPLAPPSFPPHAHQAPIPTILPPDAYARPSGWSTFWSIMRFIVVWLLAAAILNITIQVFQRQERTVFALPFPREDSHLSQNDNPNNLFRCGTIQLPDLLTTLCLFDQLVMLFCSVAACLAIIEGLLTVILQNRALTSVKYTTWKTVQKSAASSPFLRRGLGLFKNRKKRPEVLLDDETELTHSHVVVIPETYTAQHSSSRLPDTKTSADVYSASHLAEQNPVERDDYQRHPDGLQAAVAYGKQTRQWDGPPVEERPLPALPPSPLEKDQGLEQLEKDNTLASSSSSGGSSSSNQPMDVKKPPLMLENDHVWADPDGSTKDNLCQAGPSNSSYPVDIKRKDGL
ncbi:hypothetical protein EDD11_002459 [Mortierella claussenii]|nr:hypothetical protein EDD11_002459 [Mortierella claussenii]